MAAMAASARGQGSVEYLLIIGVVLIIALMVISVLSFFPSTAGESVASQSQLYWRGQAKPFSVIDAAFSSDGLCGAETPDGGIIMVVKNTDKYNLTLRSVYLDNEQYDVCGLHNATSSLEFTPGQERVIGVELDGTSGFCSDRSSRSVKLDLLYNSPYIESRVQTGAVNLHIPCN